MSNVYGMATTTIATKQSCTEFDNVTGITINAAIPNGTDIRFLLSLDGNAWQKYDTTQGAWVATETQQLTGESVITEGNTKAELESLDSTSLTPLVGATVDFAVGFMANPNIAESPPQITNITINGGVNETAGTQVKEETILSDIYELTNSDNAAVEILQIIANKTEAAGGTLTLLAATKNASDEWSEYVDYKSLIGRYAEGKCKAVRFKAILQVDDINADSVTLRNVIMAHKADDKSVVVEGVGMCVTKTYTFDHTIGRAHLMVKHPIVQDTEITAEIALRTAPIQVKDELLATGDGTQKTVVLTHKRALASHGFALYFDGVAQETGTYAYSSTDGQVTFTAADSVVVTCDYIYDWSPENFVPMTPDGVFSDTAGSYIVTDDFDYYAINDDDPVGSVATVRINIIQHTGTETDVYLGTSDGSAHSYKLAHHAKTTTISVTPATSIWKYNANTDYLTVTAPEGQDIYVSYDWAARQNYIDSFVCILNE